MAFLIGRVRFTWYCGKIYGCHRDWILKSYVTDSPNREVIGVSLTTVPMNKIVSWKQHQSDFMYLSVGLSVNVQCRVNFCLIFFRCVDLVAELSQNSKAQKEVISLIPLVAQAAHFKHYTQHLHLLETVCTQVTKFMMANVALLWYFRGCHVVQGNNPFVFRDSRQETFPRGLG